MVKYDPQNTLTGTRHHRRSIRLKGYDYASAGAYYVTIVAWRRECLFGEVVNGDVMLSQRGEIVEKWWNEIPVHFTNVETGAFVIMPNHVHGILFIRENVGATRQGSTTSQPNAEPAQTISTDGIEGSPLPLPRGPKPASLGAILAQFKSCTTKRIWKNPEFKETPIWQRNYYEHIIRNDKDLQNKTDYINANPLLWDDDDKNPINIQSVST